MNALKTLTCLAFAAASTQTFAFQAPPAVPAEVEVTALHTATAPAGRLKIGWWKQQHNDKVQAARTAKCDILFIGDSITQGWSAGGQTVWDTHYAHRNAFQIGFSGDQTQHVLWRLDNGEIDYFQPKVAVVMIGTNNAQHQRDWTAQKVADGVKAIIERVHAKSPDTEVLLLSIFPRGASPKDRYRLRNEEVNALISQYDSLEKVHYLDIAPEFLTNNGTLTKAVMPDLLHPQAAGYEIWANAIEDKLEALLKTSKAPGAEANSAIIPVPKLENDFYDWHQRHQQVVELGKTKPNVDLIFVGDSITHMFGGEPASRIARGTGTWEQYFSQYNPINMGFGWDRTQNMLWRLKNGALDHVKPKIAVVLAGTNNIVGTQNARENTPLEIAFGVKEICDTIHSKSPKTEVLVLSVMPRQGKGMSKTIQETNTILAHLDKQPGITFLSMWDTFALPNGEPNKSLFHDKAHPNAKGYALWAKTMQPTLEKLLKKNP